MNMRIKFPILFLALLLSAPSFAQQPRIDSIAVDEDKGELVLHGSFENSASAIVTVDSVSLRVVVVNDSLIRATIPLVGRGSCGSVKIITNTEESNSRLLSYIHVYVDYQFFRGGSLGYG